MSAGGRSDLFARGDSALRQLAALAANDWAFGIAAAHAFRSEPVEAFQWLEHAREQHDADLYLVKGNPQFQQIRKDARFSDFLKKMNLPE